MICRIWRGIATCDRADAYERIVRQEVIPDIEARKISGFHQIDLLRRSLGAEVEFSTLMWFSDLDAVKRFIGEDYEVSHVPQAARAALARYDERAAHYEVLDRRQQA